MSAPSIPTIIDLGSYITQAVTVLGAVVGVCIAAWFGFVVIRAALRWAKGSISGDGSDQADLISKADVENFKKQHGAGDMEAMAWMSDNYDHLNPEMKAEVDSFWDNSEPV